MTHATERLTLDEKLNLIKSRARRMGFRRHDLEDAVQEVMLAVLEFEFDEEKSNGATETTALTTVIERRLKLLKRSQHRYADLLERATDRLAGDCGDCQEGPVDQDQTGEQLEQAEVSACLADLDEETQHIARLLMEGQTPNAIADELGMGWQRVTRLISVIRERLEAAGFHSSFAE